MWLVFTTRKKSSKELCSGNSTLNPVRSTLSLETGFTLLELLCSIAILSLILTSIYGTLNMGVRAWDKGERDIDKFQRMRVIMDVLSREIKSTFPYVVTPTKLDTHKKFYAFEGKRDSISFVSTVSLRGGKKGLSWLSFWVEEDKGLVAVERDALKADIFKERDFIDRDEIEVLDKHVSRIQFEYYVLRGKKEEGEGEGEWKERWDAEKKGTLPHAVRIELTSQEEGRGEEKGEEILSELVVPLMIHGKKLRVQREL